MPCCRCFFVRADVGATRPVTSPACSVHLLKPSANILCSNTLSTHDTAVADGAAVLYAAAAASLCSLADKAGQGGAGTGQKLGGDSAAPAPTGADDMRARMAAAAEARLKAMGA